MTRNLKTLGLALVAVLAMSAMAASAASAQGKITSDGPVTLLGKNTGAVVGENALTFNAETRTECPNVLYTGHKVGSITEGVPSGSTQATITPHYGICKTVAGLSFTSTVDMNGCDYVFDLEGTTGGVAHTYGVKATVVCPVGKDIQVTVFTNTTPHSGNWCTVKITENAVGYTGLHATDQTNGKLRISGTIEGIEAHKARGPHEAPFLPCPTETTKLAKLHLDIAVEGKGGTPVSLSH
jgi:hypothetical protein